ncbi:MAG TPA: DPP IV N-terminal domain-containing protein [Steroidobacteraceae bacterium]|nr:DPP IV N-terminal domain-containing protein [Steroidobacteraceae bacterium]
MADAKLGGFRGFMVVPATLALLCAGTAIADGRHLTAQDYERAERLMPYNTVPLVDHDVQHVHWLDDRRFWYVDHDSGGDHYRVMTAATGTVSPAFDQQKLAAALAKARGKPVDATKLAISDFHIGSDGRYDITLDDTHYLCDLAGVGRCEDRASVVKTGKEPGIVSPDKKLEAFIRDWNLWIRDVGTGRETQLTFDGVKDYGYATDNAGWKKSDRPVLNWSPDSTQIATYRQDQRDLGEMDLVSTRVGHPVLEHWKYPLPGDKRVFMIEPVVIVVASRKVVRLALPPQQRLSSLCDDITCKSDNNWDDVQWAPDGKTLALVTTSRDRRHEWFRIADARTGAVRTVFEDSVSTYYRSGIDAVSWRYLAGSAEAIWYSESSDWGNLYLYSLKTGKLEHPITTGVGDVTEVVHVDPKTRTVWFRAVGRRSGVNPYYQQLWKVGLNGRGARLLTPEPCDHITSMSKDGRYFVDSCSTPQKPPVTTLRDTRTGRSLATVATADVSRLKAIGWQPPQLITVKARDHRTDLYGLLFKPTDFDPHKRYPVIDYIYPGPQIGSVSSFDFDPSHRDDQALAELGFIVVAIDGMGTPYRSASFQRLWYGQMGDNTLPDQVAALKELGAADPWIDLTRIGIWGHSGGGNATADAMFSYPAFFKVGWAESGNHDNRNYENDWGEMYQGMLTTAKDGKSNYDNQANELLAPHLQGRLMLTYGTMDDNVPPESTLLVVQALIKANKNFDMIAIPNARHPYGYATPYITRRRWDYFVRYLAGDVPPENYALKPWPWK